MPELPEVETVVRQLKSSILGRSFKNVSIKKKINKFLLTMPIEVIVDKKIRDVTRIGKSIKILFDADPELVLLIHLGMTGNIFVGKSGLTNLPKHTVFYAKLSSGEDFVFEDPRGFGQFKLVTQNEASSLLAKIAPDPFHEDWSKKLFAKKLAMKNRIIKTLLLDQTFMSGVGNIYACEALFLSKIHPQEISKNIPVKKAEALFENIKKVLQMGIDSNGASFRDYKQTSGEAGFFQTLTKVYNKKGQACVLCKSKIEAMFFAGRSTYFCSTCQQFEE